MLRARSNHPSYVALIVAACGLAACGKDAPAPAPERAASAVANVAASAPSAAPAASQAPPAEASAAAPEASASAPASALASASAAPIASASAAPSSSAAAKAAPKKDVSPSQGLPKSKKGVLAKGAADGVLKAGDAPIVKLLEPGAEPRNEASYALAKGSSQKMSMAMSMAMAMTIGGKKLPKAQIPVMSMLLDVATAEKNAAGDFKLDTKVINVGVEAKGAEQEQLAAAMRPQMEGIKGLAMAYWITPKGHVHDVKVDVPAGFPPAAQQMLAGLNQSFESIVAPLPKEAVGIGAKWQVVSRLSSAGADLLQSAIYTLRSRDGSKLSLDIALVQLAATDSIHAPGMPAGVSAIVKSFNSSGNGASEVDVTSAVPVSSKMALRTAMEIGMQGGGDDTAVDTTTNVTVTRK